MLGAAGTRWAPRDPLVPALPVALGERSFHILKSLAGEKCVCREKNFPTLRVPYFT
jgi:hypothetical protein